MPKYEEMPLKSLAYVLFGKCQITAQCVSCPHISDSRICMIVTGTVKGSW